MLKSFSYKTVSITIAFLVVFSTLSFALEKHYCGNTLVDISFFTEADTCCNTSHQKPPCCKDELTIIKGLSNLKTNTFKDIEFKKLIILNALLPSTYYTLFNRLLKKESSFENYSPPNLINDIFISHQTFLI